MKDFPAKAGCEGQPLFPAQSVHNMAFTVKCDHAADGEAAVDEVPDREGDAGREFVGGCGGAGLVESEGAQQAVLHLDVEASAFVVVA
jgi:hypothetical protein